MVFVVGLGDFAEYHPVHILFSVAAYVCDVRLKKERHLTPEGKLHRLLTDSIVALQGLLVELLSVWMVNQALSSICLVIWAARQIDFLWVTRGLKLPPTSAREVCLGSKTEADPDTEVSKQPACVWIKSSYSTA